MMTLALSKQINVLTSHIYYTSTEVCDWESSGTRIRSKFPLFNTSWQMLKVLLCCFLSNSLKIWLRAFKWATFHQHRSRGYKTVACQSWWSKRNLGHQEIYLVIGGSGTPTQEFLFDLQLWQVTVLQPLELWWWKVAHLKALSYIHLHLNIKIA